MNEVFIILNSSGQYYQGNNVFESGETTAVQYSSVSDAVTNGLSEIMYAGMYEIRPFYFIDNASIVARNNETL